jgi:hypothetical protein
MGRVARSMDVVRWASVVLLVFVLGWGGWMEESEVMGGAPLVCPRWWGVRVCWGSCCELVEQEGCVDWIGFGWR